MCGRKQTGIKSRIGQDDSIAVARKVKEMNEWALTSMNLIEDSTINWTQSYFLNTCKRQKLYMIKNDNYIMAHLLLISAKCFNNKNVHDSGKCLSILTPEL